MNLNGFESLVELQGMIFVFLIMGIVVRKLGIITESGKKSIMDLIISIILPCNIITSFNIKFSISVLINFAIILVIAFLIQILCMIISRFCYNKEDKNVKPVLQYGTVCSNAGFLGNPIAETVFGSTGLLYASIYLIPQRIVMWSAGITYFTHCTDRKSIIKKVITHPCIIAVVIGMILMLTGIQLPGFINNSIKSIGSSCTSLSMIAIGTILADVSLEGLIDKTIIKYTFIRLILIPLIVYAACKIASIDSLITGISVILAAMPAGSTTAILAAKYEGNEVFATKCVVLTTILSLITIPIWCFILKI